MNTSTAAERRAALANVHSAWYANGDFDAADIALEAGLIANGVMTPDQAIEAIHREGNTIIVRFEDGQTLSLDAYGNTMLGAAE